MGKGHFIIVFVPMIIISCYFTFFIILSSHHSNTIPIAVDNIITNDKESNYNFVKQNMLFLISRDNSNTGAPIVLYNLHKYFVKTNYRSKLIVIHNTTPGSIMNDYTVKNNYEDIIDYIHHMTVEWSTENTNKTINFEKKKGLVYKYKPIVLVNSIINFHVIEHLVKNNYEFDIYFTIHEWLDESTTEGFPFALNILQNSHVKKIILPCQGAIQNWNFRTGKEVAIKYTYTADELHKKMNDFPYFNLTSTFGFDKNAVIISMIGTVDRRKSQAEFIKNVFVKLLKIEKNLKLVLVGRVIHHFSEVLELVLDAQVEYYGKIFIVGEIQNPLSVISQSDIILSYSKNEVMPLNIIESMFLSKPVVSSNAGCCSELISKNSTGFIYYTDDELEIILTNLIKNSTERRRLGANGYTRFMQDHSERNYQQYFNFFDSL